MGDAFLLQTPLTMRAYVTAGSVWLWLVFFSTIQSAGGVASCPQQYTTSVLTKNSGTTYLRSPNYPQYYDDYSDCKWKFTAPVQYVVDLYVEDMDIETSRDCSTDSLAIYNAGERSPIAKLCGWNHNGERYRSTGRSMNLTFTTNFSGARRGFKLRLSAVRSSFLITTAGPSGRMYLHAKHDEDQFLEWPGTIPHPSNRIQWQISSDYGYVVKLYVVDMYLEDYPVCRDTYVYLYNSDGYDPLGKVCSDLDEGSSFTSQGRNMYVYFTDNTGYALMSGKSFKLRYRAKDPTGGKSSSSGSSVNYVVLVAGLVGGSVVIALLCIIVAACMCRKKHTNAGRIMRSPPGQPPRTNNNSMENYRGAYTVPSNTAHPPPSGGHNYRHATQTLLGPPTHSSSTAPSDPDPIPPPSAAPPPSYDEVVNTSTTTSTSTVPTANDYNAAATSPADGGNDDRSPGNPRRVHTGASAPPPPPQPFLTPSAPPSEF